MTKDIDLNKIYIENFSLGYLGKDISTKFALISLICYLTYKSQNKDPTITYTRVVSSLSKDLLSKEEQESLAIICSDFGYGCTEFPTFGIQDKYIPTKIKEILSSKLPF